MRKLLYLALLMGLPLFAQTNQPTFQYTNAIPSGTCVGTPPIQILYLTGQAYSCNNGTWGQFAGGGGGGGTPTGPAGGALGGFYPNPSLAASGALPNGWTATTQSPGDTSTAVANDAFVAAAVSAAAGTPGGTNGQIQYNCTGAFCGSTLSYDPTAHSLILGPTGSIAGSNSGPILFTSLYDTGAGLALDTYDFHVQIGSGVNPFSQLVIDHPSGTPGGSEILALPAFHFAGNVEVQTGASLRLADASINSSVCTDAFSHLVTSGCSGGGGGIQVTPQDFGGLADAVSVANGCTTNGTTTVVCPAAPFVSGDVGKEIHIWGAGAAGVSFGATISTFVSNTTVTVSATPATNVTQNPSIFGHDAAAAIQSCWNASSVSGVQCIMPAVTPNSFLTPAGYLVSSAGLTIPTHANITGNSFYEGTTIFGEFNGDLVSLPTSTSSVGAGQPIVGVNFANLELYMDPTLANTRGIHLNAAAGVFGPGGIYASTFSNVMVENSTLECLWSDGSVTGADLPNQVLTFNMFYCNLPNQMHTAAAINITGAHAQIIFENGQINGSTTHSNEPNPLISFSGSGGKFPADVKFYGYTCEVATTCLYFGPNTTNLHYDSGYMEQVDNALIADTASQGFTFNGNHLANVGNGTAVAQFLGGVTGAMRDNYVYGGSTPTAWAVCSGSQNVVLQSGNNGTNLQTSGCALSIAVTSGTQNANSCSADTNITMPGITTDSVVTIGYSAASEAGVTGWGTTGGMRILGRPSATSTMSWHLCNPTSGNINYGAYTFKWGFAQQ
jgi:hypothetical protein